MDIQIRKQNSDDDIEQETDNWDMPILAEGRAQNNDKSKDFPPNADQPLAENISPLRPRFAKATPGEQGFGGQARFKNIDTSKFQDARSKVREVVVRIGFPKALHYWRAANRWTLIAFAGLAADIPVNVPFSVITVALITTDPPFGNTSVVIESCLQAL